MSLNNLLTLLISAASAWAVTQVPTVVAHVPAEYVGLAAAVVSALTNYFHLVTPAPASK